MKKHICNFGLKEVVKAIFAGLFNKLQLPLKYNKI